MRSSETDQLENFKKCLNIKNKIGSTGNQTCYRVQFGNIQLYNWLKEIGITPAKTLSIGKIKIPDKFFRDFLRGHLDGDGSIQIYEDKYNFYKGLNYKNIRLIIRFTSASQNHILWLHEKIKELANITGALIYKPPKMEKRSPMWDIKFSKKGSIRVINWIYYDPKLPSLERKRLLAQKALREISQEKRKEYSFV